MLRQTKPWKVLLGGGALGRSTLATIGWGASSIETKRLPEGAHLARCDAGQVASMSESPYIRDAESRADDICARDPAAFRQPIHIS